MIVLGIDPGYAIVGYGAIEHSRGKSKMIGYGAITTQPGPDISLRLREIYQDMCKLLDTIRPDAVAVEELFFTNNVTTGIAVAEARGVILLACAQRGLIPAEYTPMQVKQGVVGYGKAEKKQVIAMVTNILRLPAPPKPDDTADALAIAICHGHCGPSRIAQYFNN
jgi:crossover junction endodeoxyribonuclease RuvC